MSYKRPPIVFDETKIYNIPLVPCGKRMTTYVYNCPRADCHIKNISNYTVMASAEGYEDAYFIDKYFEWLIYTNYIIVKE